MSVHQTIAASGPVFRIAIPAWRVGAQRYSRESCVPRGPSREDFQELMRCELTPGDLLHMRLTRAERRQLSTARRLRDALYPSADLA